MRHRFAKAIPSIERHRFRDDHFPKGFEHEIDIAADRAIAAGATPPLSFIGIGMTGIVFTDRFKNLAYKVARGSDWNMVHTEYEWFRAASKVKALEKRVPGRVRWDGENGVLVRKYVKGRPGHWGDASKLHDIHFDEINRIMLSHGWSAPEFKEDSYIVSGGKSDRGSGDFTSAVIVDASMPHRVGEELCRYVMDVVEGKRKAGKYERLEDFEYYVYRERLDKSNPNGTISISNVEKVFDRLRKAGVEIQFKL